MSAKLPESLKDVLQEVEIILNHLADANNLSDCDGEHVRAILARTGHQKVVIAQDLIDKGDTT